MPEQYKYTAKAETEDQIMKKCTALLLSLLIAFSLLSTFALADTGNESEMLQVLEVVWNGVVSGPVCDATLTLYQYQSAVPIDAEYQRMWGPFRFVLTDANGNVLMDENLDTPNKSISLTEPGDYYACVYVRDDLQGLTTSDGGYNPLIQHFCVTEIYEPTPYDDLAYFFMTCCDDYPEDHDRAFREYLVAVHSTAASYEDFSLAEGAACMSEAMSNAEPKYAALYEEFRANEGYATMEVTSLAGHEPEILADEENLGFWSGECWRFFANGLEFIVYDENGSLVPYAEYISTISEEPLPEENEPSNESSSSLPLIAVGAVVVVLIVGVAVILIRRKKS